MLLNNYSGRSKNLVKIIYLELVVIFKNNVQIKELKTNIQIEITKKMLLIYWFFYKLSLKFRTEYIYFSNKI